MMNLLKIASKVCDFIRENVENGVGLFRTEKFNVDTLKWSSEICDCDDFGDFAPFMLWLDKIKGGEKNESWVSDQFEKMEFMLKQDSGFYAPYLARKVKKSAFSTSYVINNADMTLGFEILYEITKDERYLKGFTGICDAVVQHAVCRKGFILNAVVPALNLYIPRRGCLRYKPVVSGVFAELLCDAYQITKNEECLENSRKILNAFLETKPFKKYGLVPDNVYPFIYSTSSTSSLTKSNTSIISGLLKLYEITEDKNIKESLGKALGGVESLLMSEEGSFYKSFDLKTGLVKSKFIEKGDNQSFMDNLINAFIVLHDKKYLKLAEKCAECWIKNRSDNGLFAERKVGQKDWFKCTVDSFADMVVIMSKLYNLTGKKKYKESISKSRHGFGFFLAGNGGLYDAVDCRNGEVLDRSNELKFLGGALKGMLTAHTTLQGEKIFNDRGKILLTRDR